MTRKEFVVNACLALAGNSEIVEEDFLNDDRLFGPEKRARFVVDIATCIADKLEEREYFDD